MTPGGWLQIALYFVVLTALVVPLGRYMGRVFEGERTFLSPVFRPVEAVLYRAAGVDERREQHWLTYTVAMLLFNAAGFLLAYALQRFQAVLPLNPAGMSAVAPDLAFNTAVSFTSNTNWQNYGGESTMSYLTQMAALTTQNFVSAATGIALAIALIRAFARASGKTVGNFSVDLTRCTLYVLLPLSFVAALFLVWQGVPQNIGPYVDAITLEGTMQTISQGPAASQIAIKQLGTNGGGFWNANSAVPYENPTPLSNFLEMLYILLISAALTHTFGRMVRDERQGWALYAAMSIVFLAGVLITYWAEGAGNPNFAALGLDPSNMEGKEVRFGLANSSLWAVATTAASNGSVNSMHDSFTPIGGMIPIILIQLGEIIYGGVGSGLYGMLLFVIIAVFVAGLMVGRTPEYLGKKIEAKEVKMAILAIVVLPLCILGFMAVATVTPFGLSSIEDPGPHGFSEIMYLYSSQTGNNGSAFAGFTGNTL
jgi:K+-transporting ATPase ATPase A chain